MPNKQLVMDHTGHSEHAFDPANVVSTEEAIRRFAELTGKGYVAAKRVAPGQQELVRKFDPAAEETIFFPPLQGGRCDRRSGTGSSPSLAASSRAAEPPRPCC
jgi:hypothetical protein